MEEKDRRARIADVQAQLAGFRRALERHRQQRDHGKQMLVGVENGVAKANRDIQNITRSLNRETNPKTREALLRHRLTGVKGIRELTKLGDQLRSDLKQLEEAIRDQRKSITELEVELTKLQRRS
jgi:septal ring factor EnvC (AmiA/AmiB activator)